jgi:D-galactonate transporter
MSTTLTPPDSVAPDQSSPPTAVAKIVRRLVPFLCLLYVVNYLDRTNVAMAKLKMLADTGLDEAVYGLGAGLFFIGYFIFEVPSNLILERVGARRWITRIMVTWGIVSACMMFVQGKWSFYGLRFLLGAAEAGFFPGIVLYLTYWVPSRHRASIMAMFLTSTAVSGIVGSPLAGLLMELDGVAGLRGWQWLFLVEGILPVLLGVATLLLLPDKPADVRWLTDSEKRWIADELRRETRQSTHHVGTLRHALADRRLWLLALLYFLLIMGLYGFSYWAPTIIKAATHASDLRVGLLAAIPSAVAAVSMVLIGRHADRHDERRRHIAATACIAAAGVAVLPWCRSGPSVVAALCVAAVGIFSSLGPFWALATRFLRGTSAAGGIATVNSIGCLAGFVAPYAIGYFHKTTGHFTTGLLLVAASLAAAALVVLSIPAVVDRTAADGAPAPGPLTAASPSQESPHLGQASSTGIS